jgi:hypothetical protein
MRAARSRSTSIRRVKTDLKDLFAIFPDIPWPRPSRRSIADQIRLARWRAGMSRLAGIRTLAANETMAAMVRARRR